MILSVRVDDNIKAQSEELFEELGLNISTAINVFLRACLRKRGLPFEVVLDRKPEEEDDILEYLSKEDQKKSLELDRHEENRDYQEIGEEPGAGNGVLEFFSKSDLEKILKSLEEQ